MKLLFSAILSAVIFSSLQAQELPVALDFFSDLPQDAFKTLIESGELSSSGTDVLTLKYGMKTSWSEKLKETWQEKPTTLAAEILYLIDRNDKTKKEDVILLSIFNALHAVSTMEGITYYSAERKRKEPLILTSYRVESPTHHQKLDDLVFTSIPQESQMTIFQKDNKLGDQYSGVNFSYAHRSFTVKTSNLNTLYYGILPLVSPGDLQTIFYITALKDKIAIYGSLGVKTFSFFGLERSKEESFLNRLKALSDWLKTILEKVI